MSKLKERIALDMKEAMKKKETLRLGTVRLLKAEIMKFETSGKAKKEAEDSDIIPLISRMIKQRRDAAEQFRKGTRDEMAQQEEDEINVLQDYLPPQLSNEELEKIVKETISQLGANDKTAMGKVMGAVMGKVKGQTEGTVVKNIVGKLLS
jgi:hypothetical protein